MRDICLFFFFIAVSFPAGAGLAIFLRWMSQKKVPNRQKAIADAWKFLGTWAVPYSLLMAVLKLVQRNPQGVEEYLVQCALFVSLLSGAWTEARRFRGRR